MALIIKICGLSTLETLDAAIEAGAQWVGFVHFHPSPRHLEVEAARALADHARGRATIVSLSVNANEATLDEITSRIKPDILQFHGKETADHVGEVKARYGLPVMKAVGISTRDDLAIITPYLGVADHVLLDAKPPKNATLPGGNGAAFNWDILSALPGDLPFMLSGGLTLDNVSEAVLQVRPFGIDVSSGVERKGGVKDISMIRQFVTAARSASDPET